MLQKLLVLFFSFLIPFAARAKPDPYRERQSVINNAKTYTWLVEVCKPTNGKIYKESQGTGEIVRYRTRSKNKYFCLTANHVVDLLASNDSAFAAITGVDRQARVVTTGREGGTNKVKLAWANRKSDIAILSLPSVFYLVASKDSVRASDISFLDSIADPGEVNLGDNVFLLGYRWLNASTYNYVLKDGIISATVEAHPVFGATVFYVDKMANKGMSGGVVFLENGLALGMVLAYVTESGSILGQSDDLTVVIPFSYFHSKLGELSAADKLE